MKKWGNSAKKLDFYVDNNGCFICTSHKAKISYAGHASSVVRRNGKSIPMYRWIYLEMFGGIPSGLVVRHKCDNGMCINPEHLELGTPKQNSEDMVKRGRNRNGKRKLNEKKAKEIKKLLKAGIKQTEIAKKFGVSNQTICDINKGRYWTDENIRRRLIADNKEEHKYA